MGLTEIVLLILGMALFVISFLLPAGKERADGKIRESEEEHIKEAMDRELESAKSRIGDVVDETVTYAMEKTERAMERLSNEKIMAVNEYSDTVLEQINTNHNEVIFLYDMLNEKHETLKKTVSEADRLGTLLKRSVQEAEASADASPFSSAGKDEGLKEQGETSTSGVSQRESFAAGQAESGRTQTKKTDAGDKRKRNSRSEKQITVAKFAAGLPEPVIMSDEEPEGNSNERILALHADGRSNVDIAKELGLGIGEVKLVIDLFESK